MENFIFSNLHSYGDMLATNASNIRSNEQLKHASNNSLLQSIRKSQLELEDGSTTKALLKEKLENDLERRLLQEKIYEQKDYVPFEIAFKHKKRMQGIRNTIDLLKKGVDQNGNINNTVLNQKVESPMSHVIAELNKDQKETLVADLIDLGIRYRAANNPRFMSANAKKQYDKTIKNLNAALTTAMEKVSSIEDAFKPEAGIISFEDMLDSDPEIQNLWERLHDDYTRYYDGSTSDLSDVQQTYDEIEDYIEKAYNVDFDTKRGAEAKRAGVANTWLKAQLDRVQAVAKALVRKAKARAQHKQLEKKVAEIAAAVARARTSVGNAPRTPTAAMTRGTVGAPAARRPATATSSSVGAPAARRPATATSSSVGAPAAPTAAMTRAAAAAMAQNATATDIDTESDSEHKGREGSGQLQNKSAKKKAPAAKKKAPAAKKKAPAAKKKAPAAKKAKPAAKKKAKPAAKKKAPAAKKKAPAAKPAAKKAVEQKKAKQKLLEFLAKLQPKK